MISILKSLQLQLPEGGLQLERGGILKGIEVAYEVLGEKRGNNVIYVCHALTGDSHVAGAYLNSDNKKGWWDFYVGPGKAIDTNKFCVICSNVLGGCSGTTGPGSINPDTGKEYGVSFPEISIRDMTEVQHLLLTQLGVNHLFAVVGGSMGALNALDWTVARPGFADKAICIAGASSLSPMNLSFDIIGRNMIMRDPGWNEGDYYQSEAKPYSGLALARMIAHITYLSKEAMEAKFGRLEKTVDAPKSIFNTSFQIESYLDYQGEAFVGRFDANSYLYITKAMDEFDITEGFDPPHSVFSNSQTDFMVVALSSDWLFPPDESKEVASILLRAGKKVTYCEIDSEFGHDAFLLRNDEMVRVLAGFLDGEKKSLENILNEDEIHILKMLPQKGRIVDLGCGKGELLYDYAVGNEAGRGGVVVQGIDIDLENVVEVSRRGIPIFQADLDMGLSMIPDGFYDVAVLSSTLQTVRRPDLVIREMLRVAGVGVVSFSNVASWKNRVAMFFRGEMPVDFGEVHDPFNKPIHFLSIEDFREFCEGEGISMEVKQSIGKGIFSKFFLFLGLVNLGSDKIIVKIRKKA